MTRAQCGEVLPIPNQDHLWRRLKDSENHLIWSSDLGRYIPNHDALRFDPDLSTDWRQHLQGVHGYSPADILEGDDDYKLVGEFAVSEVRGIGFEIRASPTGPTPPGCAHASVEWPPSEVPAGKKQPNKDVRNPLRFELAKHVSWVHGMPSIPPPDGA